MLASRPPTQARAESQGCAVFLEGRRYEAKDYAQARDIAEAINGALYRERQTGRDEINARFDLPNEHPQAPLPWSVRDGMIVDARGRVVLSVGFTFIAHPGQRDVLSRIVEAVNAFAPAPTGGA